MSQESYFSVLSPYRSLNLIRSSSPNGLDCHHHDYLQIIHILQGSFRVDWGEGWRMVAPGTVHILPPGHSHALQVEESHRQFGLNFRGGTDERGWQKRLCAAFPRPACLSFPMPAGLLRLLERSSLVLDELSQLEVIRELDHYCLLLLKAVEADERIDRRQELLHLLQTEHGDLSVDEMAASLHMSRAGLQRFCAAEFGCGARTLFDRVRMERAARLLLQSDRPVGECARELGFNDIYAFSRSFKRIKGCSPTAYRRLRPDL